MDAFPARFALQPATRARLVSAIASALTAAAACFVVYASSEHAPVSWPAAACLGAAFAVASLWIRQQGLQVMAEQGVSVPWLLLAAPSLSLAMFGYAVTLSSTPADAAFLGAWGSLAPFAFFAIAIPAEAAWWIQSRFLISRVQSAFAAGGVSSMGSEQGRSWLLGDDCDPESPPLYIIGALSPTELENEESEDEDLLPPGVSQHITRAALEEGGEAIYGALRAAFAPGERSQTLHIAFCPPLTAAPELTATPISGPPASIKCAEVQTFGARIEIRLHSAQPDPSELGVEFYAVSTTAKQPPATDS